MATAKASSPISAGSPGAETPAGAGETVGSVAELYLGNILFAIERCAMELDGEAALAHREEQIDRLALAPDLEVQLHAVGVAAAHLGDLLSLAHQLVLFHQ